jgi:hypothetical protein
VVGLGSHPSFLYPPLFWAAHTFAQAILRRWRWLFRSPRCWVSGHLGTPAGSPPSWTCRPAQRRAERRARQWAPLHEKLFKVFERAHTRPEHENAIRGLKRQTAAGGAGPRHGRNAQHHLRPCCLTEAVDACRAHTSHGSMDHGNTRRSCHVLLAALAAMQLPIPRAAPHRRYSSARDAPSYPPARSLC